MSDTKMNKIPKKLRFKVVQKSDVLPKKLNIINDKIPKNNIPEYLNKCSECSRPSWLLVCAKCLSVGSNLEITDDEKDDKIKSNNIKSIMDIHKLKVIKYSKNPIFKDLGKDKPKDKRYTWSLLEDDVNDKFLKKNNWGIICNKKSGAIGVDLDMYKWSEEHGCHKSDDFKKTFGNDFVKQFNTYTQKTPSGGIHLIFQYDKDLDQTESKKDSPFGKGIDIRNGHSDNILGGGYLVGAGSVFKDKNGKVGKYELINDSKIKPMPSKLKQWLIENIYTAQQKFDNTKKKDRKNKIKTAENELIKNVYSYHISLKQIEDELIKKLPTSYFTEYDDWLKFTSAMKVLGAKKLWNEYSKQNGGSSYDNQTNLKLWDSIKLNTDQNNFYVEHLFKICKNYNYLDYIKYKEIPKNNTKPTYIINRPKLTCMKDESKNIDKPLQLNLKKSQKGIVLKSDTGTGKTTLMKKELQASGQKFISIVSRISLGKEQYHSFNQHGIDCHFYANHWPDEGDSIITTIDSIRGCNRLMDGIGNYTIFIDEFNSVLEYIFQADTCLNKSRSAIWQHLIYILKNCKNFVCVDADISDLCFKFLENINRPYEYVLNSYKHNKGVKAIEIYSLEALIKKINGYDKYMVACDSKKSAEYIYIKTGKKAKLLTSKTDKLDDSTLDDYDMIIFSPAIIYGLDSNIKRPVFAYHKEFTISPTNMVQQVARCRDIEILYFCFQKKKFNKCRYIDFDECKEDLLKKSIFSKNEFNPLEDDEINRQNLFNNLYTEYLYKMDCYNTNKSCHFKIILLQRGFTVCSFNRKTSKCDSDSINSSILSWKMENFDINDNQLRDFNEKYLNLTKPQLLDVKDLFIKDELMGSVFKLKHYFEYGIKNQPLFDSNKEYENIKDDIRFKDITANELATKYDMDSTYENLCNIEEMKIKKINMSQYKYYMIDKLKVLCAYKEVRKEIKAESKNDDGKKITEDCSVNNIITANKEICENDKNEFISAYKIVFNHRGKTDPKLDTKYDCEKLLSNMIKKTFGNQIMKKPYKVRDGKKVKYEHSIDYNSEIMNLSRKIVNYKRKNKFAEEITKHIYDKNNDDWSLSFIDDLD